jgi:hypothetical protein
MSGFQLVCVLLLALFVLGIGFPLHHRHIGSAIGFQPIF